MGDPEHIWLQNAEDAKHTAEGRLWRHDKVWPNDQGDGEPTEYVRADLLATAREETRREALEEAARIVEGDVYREKYRTWPFWWRSDTREKPNLHHGSDVVRHCDELAAIIRERISASRRAAALSELAAQDAELIGAGGKER